MMISRSAKFKSELWLFTKIDLELADFECDPAKPYYLILPNREILAVLCYLPKVLADLLCYRSLIKVRGRSVQVILAIVVDYIQDPFAHF